MATQARGKKIGKYYVTSGALETTSGTFSPVLKIHEGLPASGKLVYQQDYPATIETFPTESAAFDAADKIASNWIEENGND